MALIDKIEIREDGIWVRIWHEFSSDTEKKQFSVLGDDEIARLKQNERERVVSLIRQSYDIPK